MWCIHTAEWGWCVYVCIHACVCISDSRLSLKLKQKSVHPPSQLYLFMPSASQHPHACKHTTHPVRVTQTHQKKQAPRWGLVTRDFVLIIPCRSEESPLITRFLAQREVIVYHILCAIFTVYIHHLSTHFYCRILII